MVIKGNLKSITACQTTKSSTWSKRLDWKRPAQWRVQSLPRQSGPRQRRHHLDHLVELRIQDEGFPRLRSQWFQGPKGNHNLNCRGLFQQQGPETEGGVEELGPERGVHQILESCQWWGQVFAKSLAGRGGCVQATRIPPSNVPAATEEEQQQ